MEKVDLSQFLSMLLRNLDLKYQFHNTKVTLVGLGQGLRITVMILFELQQSHDEIKASPV